MDDRELNSIAESPAELAVLKKLLNLLSQNPQLLQNSDEKKAEEDPYVNLLMALKPFLSPRQAERLPKAIELVRFLQKGEGGQ